MVDCARLESVWGRNVSAGSNPALSAIFYFVMVYLPNHDNTWLNSLYDEIYEARKKLSYKLAVGVLKSQIGEIVDLTR